MQALLVDISGPEPPPAYVTTLLSACSTAARSAKCSRAEPNLAPESSQLTVHVVLGDELHFELRVDADAQRPALSRALVFRSADAVEERWRSVGLSIASLVSEGRPVVEREPPAPVPSATKVVPPAAPPASTPRLAPAESWRFGAGLQTGAGASHAPPRLGGFLSVVRRLPVEPTFALVTARYGVGRGPDGLIDLEWTTLGAGLGASLLREPLALRVQAGAIAQLVAATATDPGSGETSSASRWLGGGLLGLELGWPGRGPVGATFSAEAARLSGGTAVRLNQRAVAQSPALQWGFQVGLEYRL